MKELHKNQRFEIRRVDRASIKGADYNPRKIDKASRAKLSKNLKTIGLVEPIVVNSRTMNVVSGHQRLSILDDLSKSPDYSLDVAIVNLTESQEREQNLFMNNPQGQGQWDQDLLVAMFSDEIKIDVDLTGFELIDLEAAMPQEDFSRLFGRDPIFSDGAREEMVAETPKTAKQMQAENPERVPDFKKQKERIKAEQKAADPDFYVIVVCKDRESREKLMELAGYPAGEKYIDGARLATLISEKS